MTTITLDTIEFSDFDTSGWVFSGLVDWFGQVDNKKQAGERPQGHGAFNVTTALRASRAISFTAAYLADTEAEAQNAIDELAAVGAEEVVKITVAASNGTTWRWVRVQLSAATDTQGDATGVVAVDMLANDPRRYADAAWISTGLPTPGQGLVWPVEWPAEWPGGGVDGRVMLLNTGRAPSAPSFRLAGGFESALITCMETGARIGFDRYVPPGSVVEIDTANRRAVIDGQSDVSRWLRYREWETVPAQSSRSFQFDATNTTGTPTLEGRVFPAWW